MPGQVTSTSPMGRDVSQAGYPMRMCEMLATLRTPGYVVRGAVHTPQLVIQTKRAIRRAFDLQLANRCHTFVEILSTCPTNWGMTPAKALDWLHENMLPFYPLGVFRDPDLADGQAPVIPKPDPRSTHAH
jgi:2-oxoglutarate ferredoxin oxidoreductase subunit beta